MPPHYELLYHPGIPGRGEFIRLALEAAGAPYSDLANESAAGKDAVYAICTDATATQSFANNPPVYSPPALRVAGAGRDGQALVIHQTPVILSYLGPALGLVPADEPGRLWVAQLACTALDLNDEVHDTHHPVAVMKYYEEQKAAALEKARDVRTARLPKYFSHFQRTLEHNRAAGRGRYLVDAALTYADTTVWQVLDGLYFAFPAEMAARRREFPALLDGFYESVKAEARVKEYLGSARRLPYGMGVFRHYPELDRQE